MQVGDSYSHKGGKEFIMNNFPTELNDIYQAIESVNAVDVLTKLSEEKSKPSLLFSPVDLNLCLKTYLHKCGWTEVALDSKKGFREPRIRFGDGNEFREMDGIKNKVGLEVQFGKYAFMGYDIFSKMPIFAKRGLIVCGIEVVVMPSMIPDMSTGVSSFSQIVMDMQERGEADIDIPTLILGIECTLRERQAVQERRLNYMKNPEMITLKKRSGARPGPK